jgi:hypothetical protein
MLDFLGVAPKARVMQLRPRSFRINLELHNVAAREDAVKCLFEDGV